MKDGLVLGLSIVGALACVLFAIWVVLRFAMGRPPESARGWLIAAGVGGAFCAVLGILIPMVG